MAEVQFLPKLGEVAQRAGGVCDNTLVGNCLLLTHAPSPMLGRVAMPSAPHAELRSTRALPSPRALRGSGHPLSGELGGVGAILGQNMSLLLLPEGAAIGQGHIVSKRAFVDCRLMLEIACRQSLSSSR